MSKTGLEERDAAAGAVAVAPRVTLEQIQSLVASERYFVDETLTICVLTLKNGFKVTGESAAADPANFNEELGRKIAREKAVAQIWPLAGFLLRDQLHKGSSPVVMRMKLVLSDRRVQVAWATDAEGKHLGRSVERKGYDGQPQSMPDPQDPANWRPDGEMLSFYPVCAGFDADGVAQVEENRIFGFFSPNVKLEAHVRNQHVLDRLEQGRAYYVDFVPA